VPKHLPRCPVLFSRTFSLCFFISLRDKLSHRYQPSSHFIVCGYLISTFQSPSRKTKHFAASGSSRHYVNWICSYFLQACNFDFVSVVPKCPKLATHSEDSFIIYILWFCSADMNTRCRHEHTLQRLASNCFGSSLAGSWTKTKVKNWGNVTLWKSYFVEASLCWSVTLLKHYSVEVLLCRSFTLYKRYFVEALLCWIVTLLKHYFVEVLLCWSV
jgi:hypothetical protein